MPAALVENSQVICEVWASNLEEEMRKIREIVLSYSYIAMDTEFPGVVVRPIGEFRSSIDYQYQLLRCNVDLLKIIQLGLTFTNEKGEYPSGINTWQFNFKFNLTEDMYSQDSIDLLANSGLQFQKHEEEGIDTLHFAELLMTSGVVLCDNVKWLSFHSGYDFGYMVKLLTDSRLPEEEHEFFHILNLFFPSIYDVKYLMKSCKNLKGGLQEVADQLDLQRIGRQHQAGSDSLLTGMAFFRMKEGLCVLFCSCFLRTALTMPGTAGGSTAWAREWPRSRTRTWTPPRRRRASWRPSATRSSDGGGLCGWACPRAVLNVLTVYAYLPPQGKTRLLSKPYLPPALTERLLFY
ncbi:CCR4-NOT transcription complex subunit 8 isoform 1-T4 [Megaptera novaeangliae]